MSACHCLPARQAQPSSGKQGQCPVRLEPSGLPGGRAHPPTLESGILLDSFQLQRGRRLVMHEPKRLAILAARLEAHIRLHRERSGGSGVGRSGWRRRLRPYCLSITAPPAAPGAPAHTPRSPRSNPSNPKQDMHSPWWCRRGCWARPARHIAGRRRRRRSRRPGRPAATGPAAQHSEAAGAVQQERHHGTGKRGAGQGPDEESSSQAGRPALKRSGVSPCAGSELKHWPILLLLLVRAVGLLAARHLAAWRFAAREGKLPRCLCWQAGSLFGGPCAMDAAAARQLFFVSAHFAAGDAALLPPFHVARGSRTVARSRADSSRHFQIPGPRKGTFNRRHMRHH